MKKHYKVKWKAEAYGESFILANSLEEARDREKEVIKRLVQEGAIRKYKRNIMKVVELDSKGYEIAEHTLEIKEEEL